MLNGRRIETLNIQDSTFNIAVMRAMVLPRPAAIETSPLELREVPLPQPGPDEIRLQVEACGICRTDLHVIEAELPPQLPEVIPGHQVVGTVEACGSAARRFKI